MPMMLRQKQICKLLPVSQTKGYVIIRCLKKKYKCLYKEAMISLDIFCQEYGLDEDTVIQELKKSPVGAGDKCK